MSVVRSARASGRTGATPGIAVKSLRDDRTSGAPTFSLRVDADARVPQHDHPGGEELFVIQGDLQIDESRG